MKKGHFIVVAVLAIVLPSVFLVYWLDPQRVIWTKDGTVAATHQSTKPSNGANWNALVYIYELKANGYLVDTGYIALNGPGIQGRGNFCWDSGNGTCLNIPLSLAVNQTVTVEAMNNGNYMIRNR